MKELSLSTKSYLFLTYTAGITILTWHAIKIDLSNPLMLGILCLLASLTLILKVEGATNRSHYSFSFLIYGFTFALYGISEAILVIVVSNLAEWIWSKQIWYIQLFNTGCYLLVMQLAGFVYQWINPTNTFATWQVVLALALSMATFNLLNHLMVGIVVWLARGENFKRSGVFDFFPLILDLTLLYFGASLSFVWIYNPFALILFLTPIYLIYSTLRVPALERQTEIDNKTGLYNHQYFKQQVNNELNRANRFDRPLTIIMADLDLLRNINNTYGHLAGDAVLIGVAKTLKQSVREYDVAARFGGEEFAILLPETTIQQAYERAEYIRKAIEEAEFTVPTCVSPIRATMSFGIACRESFGQTTDEIIHNADTALYHSKLNGRNRAFAYTKETYINFLQDQEKTQAVPNAVVEVSQYSEPPSRADSYKAPPPIMLTPRNYEGTDQSVSKADLEQSDPSNKFHHSKSSVNLYIGMITLASLVFLAFIVKVTNPMQYMIPLYQWISLLIISVLIAMSEWYSVNLYFRQTAISTSAIPILVGYLLFGPIGTFVVSLTVATTLLIKYRSPISRFFFNFGNHVLAGALCVTLMLISGKEFLAWSPIYQISVSLVSAVIMYLTTTWLIAIGISLDLKQPVQQIWKEQYSWLGLYYVGIGLAAYTFVVGYHYDKTAGILLMVTPMLFLRLSQKQYVSRTREVVMELREKNQSLKKTSQEIADLNEGLLETLSEVIDLRDPYMLDHSKQVSHYATEIAKSMKLNDKQVELIRKAALLHDIGKLGISDHILTKPSRLTIQEYEVMKRHAILGANLMEKSPSLRSLMPIVRHHHEFFNGTGYPDKLKGNQIGIEARIVAIADAIEAMLSDRPYRKAFELDEVIREVKRYTGSQFDPLVAESAIRLLEKEFRLGKPDHQIRAEMLPKWSTSTPPS